MLIPALNIEIDCLCSPSSRVYSFREEAEEHDQGSDLKCLLSLERHMSE